MSNQLITKRNVLDKLQRRYGNKYTYIEQSFIDIDTPFSVICPKHGEFKGLYINIYRNGCGKCCAETMKIVRGIIQYRNNN